MKHASPASTAFFALLVVAMTAACKEEPATNAGATGPATEASNPANAAANKPEDKPKAAAEADKKAAADDDSGQSGSEDLKPDGPVVAAYNAFAHAWNKGSLDNCAAGMSENVKVWQSGQTIEGKDKVMAAMTELRKQYPDHKVLPRRIFVSDKTLVAEVFTSGTFKGALEMNGKKIEPTDKAFGVEALHIVHFDESHKIVELRNYTNFMAIGQQTGAFPLERGQPPVKASVAPEGDAGVHRQAGDAKNAEVVKTMWTAWAKGEDFNASFAEDFKAVDNGTGTTHTSYDTMKEERDAVLKAFPDVKMTVDNVWVIGPYAIGQISWTGKFTGDMMGLKANNKEISGAAADVFALKDGKITTIRSYSDPLPVAAQMMAK